MKKPHDFNRSTELETIFEIMNSSREWMYLSLSSYIPGNDLDTNNPRSTSLYIYHCNPKPDQFSSFKKTVNYSKYGIIRTL